MRIFWCQFLNKLLKQTDESIKTLIYNVVVGFWYMVLLLFLWQVPFESNRRFCKMGMSTDAKLQHLCDLFLQDVFVFSLFLLENCFSLHLITLLTNKKTTTLMIYLKLSIQFFQSFINFSDFANSLSVILLNIISLWFCIVSFYDLLLCFNNSFFTPLSTPRKLLTYQYYLRISLWLICKSRIYSLYYLRYVFLQPSISFVHSAFKTLPKYNCQEFMIVFEFFILFIICCYNLYITA